MIRRAPAVALFAALATLTVAPGIVEAAESSKASRIFVDRAAELGIDFFHFNGMTGNYHMAEVNNPGTALFDYDNDGDLDVYVVQGGMLDPGKTYSDALVAPRHPLPMTDRLYRNELVGSGHGELRFTDVTEDAGLEPHAYGMGVTVGDYDSDGSLDLYITCIGSNVLLRNLGDGTFEDVTAAAGIDDQRWSVPAAFLDFDHDGRLDLFVGNYLDFDLETVSQCRDFTGALDYCGPDAFPPLPDRLFRNRGDGSFEDATQSAGLRTGFGPALGVVAADLDADGWPDLYVANDGKPNNLWLNDGQGGFTDEALLAGCAVNADGQSEASMGVDAADFDGDGDLDLFMTHLLSETNTLYRNEGGGLFEDATGVTGIGTPSRLYTGFGTGWLDYDNDGWLDLFVANGAVKKNESLARLGDPYPFHEPNQLFRNLAGKSFEEVTAAAGEVFELSEVSRGAAFGDLDNDGDTDIAVINNNGPARLLINQVGNASRWLGIDAVSRSPARYLLGTRAVLLRPGDRTSWGRVRVDGSFASASDPRMLFGLGPKSAVGTLRVFWPDGSTEEWTDLELDRYHRLVQGSGKTVQP